MVVASNSAVRLVEIREWQTCELPGVSLDAADRSLVGGLATKDRRVVIDELRSGLRIHATSWVGVIRLSQIEIHITPKLVGTPTWLVAMLDYAGGIETLQRLAGEHSIAQAGSSLLDLFTLLLCEASQQLWDGGLLADYVERVDDLPVVRGRILLDRQVRERFGRVDRLICRYDERETDIAENQLIAAALRVASRRARSVSLRRRAHRLASLFLEQCDPSDLDLSTMDEAIVYNRLNQHYEPGHVLAWLVLDGLGVRDLHSAGPTDCFAFLMNMNTLFEAFVDRLVRQILGPLGATVASQKKDGSVLRDLTTTKTYASVIPDLVVSGIGEARAPMDAKYKTYEGEKADRGDLYQAFLYAMAYRAKHDHQPRALLLYPTATEVVALRQIVVANATLGDAAEIRLCSLPVASLLRQHVSGGRAIEAVRAVLLDTLSNEKASTRIGA
jgi:5-methylcytosine-specific restriction enzyme subunit McrC